MPARTARPGTGTPAKPVPPLPIHPHMLRHSCGYHLAAKGIDTRAIQQYLGHNNILNTARYTALSPHRFKAFWPD